MKCQSCQKEKATIHLTDFAGGQKQEMHLCEKCAAAQGTLVKVQAPPLAELLSNFVSAQAGAQELAKLKCSQCGMTFAEFRAGGLLGCPNDYEAFAAGLAPLIERTHDGGSQHAGKTPAGPPANGAAGRVARLARLRRDLSAAVETEDYERAAALRDEIRVLEQT